MSENLTDDSHHSGTSELLVGLMMVLDASFDQVQGLEQDGGTSSREGARQKAFENGIGGDVHPGFERDDPTIELTLFGI